ncbi:MAG: hypothetical protein B6245_13890 [Desulfobacteraceae bacterium 4572_88]|nr:MAG: hypothetical protein B6245_13890 [Desulfobacteraceae bacterium 4572_88]
MKKSSKKLWIAWEDDGSIRSRVLSKEMNAIFHTFTMFEGDNPLFFLRYPAAILQTFLALDSSPWQKKSPKPLWFRILPLFCPFSLRW